jgi:Fe2+ or Zn2+ uptake regulation protein
MNLWKIDTEQDGISVVMQPYKWEAILFLLDKETPQRTIDVFNHVDFKGHHISKASVYNFLEKLFEYGYINKEHGLGKGGAHKLYSKKLTYQEIIQTITIDTLKAIQTAFPKDDHLKYLLGW